MNRPIAALNVVMLGPPGAGKGTQAERFARTHGLPKISTGDILRDAVTTDSALGRAARATMDRGELVGDDVMIGIVGERLARPDTQRGFVLDGFPRNLAQAEALDEMLADIGRALDAVLFFDLADDVAVERLRGRGREEGREDDMPEAIARRLELYHHYTEPVVERYRATGKLVPLHAERSIEQVANEIEEALELLDEEAVA